MNLLHRNQIIYVLLMAFCFLGTALWNKGFIASDEYWIGIDRYIPAQNAWTATLTREDDVKSPVQLLPMHLVAQGALAMGVEQPFAQYSLVLLMMGLYSFIGIGFGLRVFHQHIRHHGFVESFASSQGCLVAPEFLPFTFLTFTFYFANPLIFTRPMCESLAAPMLFLSAIYAFIYDEKGSIRNLGWSIFYISVSFLFRPQSGLTALTIVLLPLIKKRWRDFAWVCLMGVIAFSLTGLPDLFLIGKFHSSLIKITNYNVAHGEDYGRQPLYYFPMLLVVFGFLPFFMRRYAQGFVRSHLIRFRVFLLYIFFFIVLHSFFPQKFERFLIPIFPHLLMVVLPFLFNLFENRNLYPGRWYSLLGLNLLLFIVATFFPAQKNIIDLALYLNKVPEIRRLISIDSALEWIPRAFVTRMAPEVEPKEMAGYLKQEPLDCRALVVTRLPPETVTEGTNEIVAALKSKGLQFKTQFDVNPIEKWAYRLNPKNNMRRVPLQAWGCAP